MERDYIPHLEDYDAFASVPPGKTWGINFGGGVNSTALLLFCHDRRLRPDWVLFEHPALFQVAVRVNQQAKDAGNAETKDLFRSYDPNAASCMCSADGCSISEGE